MCVCLCVVQDVADAVLMELVRAIFSAPARAGATLALHACAYSLCPARRSRQVNHPKFLGRNTAIPVPWPTKRVPTDGVATDGLPLVGNFFFEPSHEYPEYTTGAALPATRLLPRVLTFC